MFQTSDGCQTKKIESPSSDVISCTPNVSYSYGDTVDFRIIVLTFNRPDSLLKLLTTLNTLELDEHQSAALEIFIDRNKRNELHTETVETAKNFSWKINGTKRVYVWRTHVGLYGNWIDSWRPKPNSNEIALILEDDLSVSPYALRWLKAAHNRYGTRDDIQGYTLTSGPMTGHAIGGKAIKIDKSDSAFLYRVLGSFGFSPHPKIWREFQDWFHKAVKDTAFHPYVPNTLMDVWYRGFEKKGTQDTMWTMWFVWYTNKHNLYCVYNNIHEIAGVKNTYLVEHRHEPGIHYGGKAAKHAQNLLSEWKDVYINFPLKTKKVDFKGNIVS